MKKIIPQLLILSLAAASMLTACSKPGESASSGASRQSEPSEAPVIPDTATPEGAATELFQGAKNWDIPAVEAHLPEGVTIGERIPPAFEESLNQVLNRMDYKIGDTAVDGDTAVVEMEITSVDAKSALNDAVATAVGYMAKKQLSGQQVEDYTELVDEVVKSIDIPSLPTTTITADAHMIKGSDGEWKLDLSDEANMPLLNAVTGGSIEMVEKLKEMAGTYGIDLDDYM